MVSQGKGRGQIDISPPGMMRNPGVKPKPANDLYRGSRLLAYSSENIHLPPVAILIVFALPDQLGLHGGQRMRGSRPIDGGAAHTQTSAHFVR